MCSEGAYDVGAYDVGAYDVGAYDVGAYDVGGPPNKAMQLTKRTETGRIPRWPIFI